MKHFLVWLWICVTLVACGPSGSTRIAFWAYYDGHPEICVMNADGSSITRLTHGDELRAGSKNPCWSPDGNCIAFESTCDDNEEIYVMNADGSGQTNLTKNTADDYDPAWSPDGNRIAFVSRRDGNDEIYVMNADGSGQTNLMMNYPPTEGSPAWSPDGRLIVFHCLQRSADLQKSGLDFEICVINADGTGMTRLTYNPADDGYPTWSPDGNRIIFISGSSKYDIDIYVMNADGRQVRNLTKSQALVGGPSWSPR